MQSFCNMSERKSLKAIRVPFEDDDVPFEGQIKELPGGDYPFPDDPIGAINHYLGGDWMSGRSLKLEPSDKIPEFRLILTCNKIPTIPQSEGTKFYFFDKESLDEVD